MDNKSSKIKSPNDEEKFEFNRHLPYYTYSFPFATAYPIRSQPPLYSHIGNPCIISTSQEPPAPLSVLPGGIPPWRDSTIRSSTSKVRMSLPVSDSTPSFQKVQQNPLPKASNTAWPSSLKAFVERCFSLCRNDSERDEMESLLRSRINESLKAGTIGTTNWAQERVPVDFSTSNTSYQPVIKPSVEPVRSNDNISLNTLSFFDKDKKEARSKRFFTDHDKFEPEVLPTKRSLSSSFVDDCLAPSGLFIMGTCQQLEKSYLRLTAAPDPSLIRPLPILEKSLEILLSKWRDGKEYHYLCDQLKSIRQDLTVQNIRNEFTVRVYETHARISIQFDDFGEYNQCLAQLKTLYLLGVEGHEAEFTSYRLLYIFITENQVDFCNELRSLQPEIRSSPEVSCVLEMHRALLASNFARFFFLINSNPIYLQVLRPLIAKLRVLFFENLRRSLKSHISISFLSSILALGSELEGIHFLAEANVPVPDENFANFKLQ